MFAPLSPVGVGLASQMCWPVLFRPLRRPLARVMADELLGPVPDRAQF